MCWQKKTPQVDISYSSGSKSYKIATPWRKKVIKRIARRSYPSMTTAVVESETSCMSAVHSLSFKMKQEMSALCSLKCDSILRDNIEAVKHFSWMTIWLELEENVPTLMCLLKSLIKRPEENKPLLCFLASAILKQCSPKLGLIQRAISIVLYGNGTNKEVWWWCVFVFRVELIKIIAYKCVYIHRKRTLNL